MTQHIRTEVRDAILAVVSDDLDADAVQGVEWIATRDTVAAIRDPRPRLVDWETYNRAGEVA